MEKIRDNRMDFIKGVTIFLMMWGHIVQHFYGNEGSFYGNMVYKVIYTFHMPLFMFISGYFFKSSLDKRSLWEIIKGKTIQLGIPIFIWTIFYYGEDLLYTKALFSWKQLFHLFFRRLWFLAAFLMLSIFVSLIWQFFKRYSRGFILTCIIMGFLILIIPDELFSAVFFKFMYPYFVAGILANQFEEKLRQYKKPIFIISFIIYLLMLIGFQDNYYVYTSGMYLPFNEELANKLFIIYYRYFIGFAGIITIIGILELLYSFGHNLLLTHLGKYTMELYIVHIFFLNYLTRWNAGKYIHMNEVLYNLVFTPFATMILILVCMLIIKLLHKNRYAKGILFGNWR